MDTSINTDELLAEINRQLPLQQHIQKDDPVYAGVVLNKVVLDSYTHILQRSLEDMLRQVCHSAEQQVERAEVVASRLILKSGGTIEKQLDASAHRWEERLRKVGHDTETSICSASRWVWAAALTTTLFVCILIGSNFGTLVFHCIHK